MQRRMARWLDGPAHQVARQDALDALAPLSPSALRDRAAEMVRLVPVIVLAEALGFADPLACALRQPAISAALLSLGAPVAPDIADAMAAQLSASGRDDPDEAANVVALLHQCLGATAALIDGLDPPVPSTVRISPSGERVEIPLADTPFGAGPHACPGREHALALADGILGSPRNP